MKKKTDGQMCWPSSLYKVVLANVNLNYMYQSIFIFLNTNYHMKIKVINEKFSVKNSSSIANDYKTCMCSAYIVINCTY